MIRFQSLVSRLVLVAAVLMLGRPPCAGGACCSEPMTPQKIQTAERVKSDCCRSRPETLSAPRPFQGCDDSLPATDACPFCRPAPPSSTSGAVVRSVEEQKAESIDTALALPTLFENSSSALGFVSLEVPRLDGVPIYLRLAHSRN